MLLLFVSYTDGLPYSYCLNQYDPEEYSRVRISRAGSTAMNVALLSPALAARHSLLASENAPECNLFPKEQDHIKLKCQVL